MGPMMFTVVDAERAVHSWVATPFADVLIPALSDDPETIAELQHAMRRFLPSDHDSEPLADWATGDCDEPGDAGICLIDLAGRLIVYQSNFDTFLRRGQVTLEAVDENNPEAARWIPYYIADEWLVTEQLDGWRATADQRRQQRQANPPFDTRAVLYGKVAEFIAEECWAARGGSTGAEGVWTPAVNWQFRELPERAAAGKPLHAEDAIAEIHARWLMTPRDDLRGRTPREVLQAKRSDLAFHLQDREFQWSNFRQCPPPLWRESTAYRYGGYGTDEIVLYYYLLRHLIHECWEWVVEPSPEQTPLTQAEVVERLGASQQEWLHTPNGEFCRGKTPAYMIQRERLRLPMGSEGADLMIDDDCPLCQMMADSGPCFWHLDGCGMDEEFPFEMFAGTREEWEEEQRTRAERNANWQREQQELAAAGKNDVVPGLDEEPVEESSPVWQRSFAYRRASDSPEVTVFGIGAHLAELIVDLRQTGGSQDWIETLNGDFGNLRAAVADPSSSLVDPVVEKFTEHLAAVSDLQPDLSAKCQDLERQLHDFARRLNGEADADEELPF